MAGSEATPGAAESAHSSDTPDTVLLGPLSRRFVVGTDFPFRGVPIKAIWRNEIGDAS